MPPVCNQRTPWRAEQVVPVDVAWRQAAGCRVPAVGDPDGAAHAEAALGEVEPVAHVAPDAVEGHPRQEGGVDAALQHEVLEQPADLVVDERGHDRGAQAEAAPQPARHVVLAAALPDPERARVADASLTGIEPQHDLAERDQVVAAGRGRADLQAGAVHRSPVRVSAATVRRGDLRRSRRRRSTTAPPSSCRRSPRRRGGAGSRGHSPRSGRRSG